MQNLVAQGYSRKVIPVMGSASNDTSLYGPEAPMTTSEQDAIDRPCTPECGGNFDFTTRETPQLPRIFKATQSHTLTSGRMALLQEIGYVDVVPIDELFKAILRPPPINAIEIIKADLVRKGTIIIGHGWSEFTTRPSKMRELRERACFLPLQNIYADVVNSAISCGFLGKDDSLLESLVVHGDKELESDGLNSSKPDGYILLKDQWEISRKIPDKPDWDDVLLPMEFKKHDNKINRDDNIMKLLWSFNFKLRSDPRCRYISGLTIEDTKTRLWHADRSGVVASKRFNFMKEPEKLIQIFLALATSTEVEVGLDPTIQRLKPNKAKGTKNSQLPARKCYHISVRCEGSTKTFETVKLVSDRGTNNIRSSGTRVWTVFDINDPERTHKVLKDFWSYSEDPLEGKTVQQIRTRLEEQPEGLRHIPAVLTYGPVQFEDGSLDETFHSIRRGKRWPKGDHISVFADSGPSHVFGPRLIGARGYPRLHQRLVYDEQPGIQFTELSSYQEILTAIPGGLKALQAINAVGYIHRDVTAHNIILSADRSRGLLIDFEHAKEFSEMTAPRSKRRDYRSAESNFMAVEVAKNLAPFLFYKVPTLNPLDQDTSKLQKTVREWFHYPLHDLESIWWILVWSTLAFSETGSMDSARRDLRSLLFPRIRHADSSNEFREMLIVMNGAFAKHYKEPQFGQHLVDLRDGLVSAYQIMQNDLSPQEDRPIYRETLTYFLKKVEQIENSLGAGIRANLQPVKSYPMTSPNH
ncbi:hypothetical protein CPB86DRAFT_353309 [Serendipita vermifera]|nr:hypothetical protein CPB86DRAFT_353309 [Serendipita vermifera]